MENIKRKFLVLSGKGGVGKSTIAVNLAACDFGRPFIQFNNPSPTAQAISSVFTLLIKSFQTN